MMRNDIMMSGGNEITEFVNVRTLAKILGVCPRTVWSMRDRGVIPCVKVPGTRIVKFHLPTVRERLLRLQNLGKDAL